MVGIIMIRDGLSFDLVHTEVFELLFNALHDGVLVIMLVPVRLAVRSGDACTRRNVWPIAAANASSANPPDR